MLSVPLIFAYFPCFWGKGKLGEADALRDIDIQWITLWIGENNAVILGDMI